ncbi:MAG: MBL fold metallo-hydrolase, partial [Psychrosphaera sp.]|nr:MBL fold metallo-hydrolase [Psychrosphaera sp.]
MKISHKYLIYLLVITFFSTSYASTVEQLQQKVWYSGMADCNKDNHGAIEVYQYGQDTFILRQNMCLHPEAPFMYLLFGEQKALLIDTGATASKNSFPLADIVNKISLKRAKTRQHQPQTVSLLVVHSHSHSDHIAADKQFYNSANTTVIAPNNQQNMMTAFGLKNWPEQIAQIDLGSRLVNIIPTPGHLQDAITFYDHKTQWLMTGDTLYPGRLYINQWAQYKQSIDRLVKFSQNNPIAAILGAHIEMSSTPKKDYVMGSTFHPREASLVL